MYDKYDFLFFYFTLLIRNNLKVMSTIRKFITLRKHIAFSILDALFIYYYIMIGLQAEYAFRYVEYYVKTRQCMQPYRVLLPLLQN